MNTSQPTLERTRPNYVGVFGVLAVLTAIELGVTYLPVPRILILIPLAIIKAALVALFYMHLKIDRRVYSVLFGMGLLMGIGLIVSLVILFRAQLIDIR